jgi:hypothetical protein
VFLLPVSTARASLSNCAECTCTPYHIQISEGVC